MVSHWFSGSQWQLPNESDYRKLQSLFTQVAIEKHQNGELATPHHQLVAMWHSLNRKYSELLEEYKSLRRHFSVSVSVPLPTSGHINPFSFTQVNTRAKNPLTCCGRSSTPAAGPAMWWLISLWGPVQPLKQRLNWAARLSA
jgi:hypothetical protein